MIARRLTALAAGAVVVLAAVAATGADAPQLKFEKYELPNGLDVILHEDHTIPMVAVNIWYHVGSKNEKRGRTGFAHLFEHMMFQGSQNHDGEYFAPLEKVGGAINGSTSEDRTNYWENVPSNYLELALALESDRMGFLLPAMTQAKLDNQRDVVKNERRQGVDNQPYGKAHELLAAMLYPSDHPYSWPVIGSMDDLSAASLDDVKDFFRTYYTPQNASLAIAGDFDPATAKKLVEKYFGSLPPGPPVARLEAWVPELPGVKRLVAQDNVKLPQLWMAWLSPAYYAPGDAALDLFANVLAAGKNSRLYKSLVYEQQIAQDITAMQSSSEIGSAFMVIATAKPGHTLDELERAIDAELAKARDGGITGEELRQAQTSWEATFVRSLQSVGGFGGRADKLNEYNVMLGDPGKLDWDLDRYGKATLAEVNGWAKRVLDPGKRAILHIVPQGELKPTGTEPDRKLLPAGTAEPSFTPPTIQRAKLGNGLDLLLVEDHRLPLVQAGIVIRSGWAADPPGRPGAGAFTAELLDEGTATRKALQIADEAKSLGAQLATRSNFDSASVSVNALKKSLEPSLALMVDVLLNPTFPQEEIDRLKPIYLGRIAQESKQPFQTALKAYQRVLYGPDHPYGQPFTGSGTEASVKALTRDDLVAYWKANYVPENATAIVVGDITLAEAKASLDKALAGWKSAKVTRREVAAPAAATATKIVIVDKPGAPQSVIVAGNLGIRRNAPDQLAVEVMNNSLGSMFGSRINLNLREDKGYTYGAGSMFMPTRGVGPFMAYAPVQTQFTKESVSEIVKEFKDIVATRPLSTDELKDSKNNLVRGFPQGFETIGGVAAALSEMVAFDLPADEWQTYVKRVNAIDGGAATKAAKDHIRPDALTIVVVGDREKIEPGLKELNLGPIEYLDTAKL